MRLLREGLQHTQKVYAGVKEFTNLVKKDAVLEMETKDLRSILVDYLSLTAYTDQVAIDWLPSIPVNEPLFCTAIDNFIRNGLKYNDSETKVVAIMMVDDYHLAIVDNGRGMTEKEFLANSKPYVRGSKNKEKESGSGLGLNISIAILEEHGFTVSCLEQESGTMIKVRIRK
jgi:signal transduction histidine kinase